MSIITANTRLLGLIGWPVLHSKSPVMHNAAAADLRLDLIYVPLPVRPANLAKALLGLPALGFLGANITIPHKETILPLIDVVDPAAQAIGAVNTIVVSGLQREDIDLTMCTDADSELKLIGYNTDWSGFMEDLAELRVKANNQECLILGAGGSARAVAYGLALAGSQVHILARRKEQAIDLVNALTPHCPAGSLLAYPWSVLNKADHLFKAVSLIVNCTPLGMSPNVAESPWPMNLPFPEQAFIYDLVYNPIRTKLMKQAQAANCKNANGLGTLVRQGAQAFYLWTGKQPNIDVMFTAAREPAGNDKRLSRMLP